MHRRIFQVLCLYLLLVCPATSQNLRPFKDLIFSQVAAGGTYESWITVTNRGTETYTGTLNFYQAKAVPWNPTVDGVSVTGGKLTLSLPAGTTRTMKVTGGQNTDSGFAVITADNLTQTNFLEGNLTYFVKSGSAIVDSVGVTPSSQFLLSTIPFEDFSTVALALVNRDPTDLSASVRLSVFSENNNLVIAKMITVGKNEQWVKFLYQELGSQNLTRGRLEIQSNVAVSGTALMFLQNQFSSLPLQPTMHSYNVSTTVKGTLNKGQMTLWADGSSIRGLLIVTEAAGMPIEAEPVQISGQMVNGRLKLVAYVPASSYGTPEVVGFATSTDFFSFDANSMQFEYKGTNFRSSGYSYYVYARSATGTFTITRIN